MRSLVLVMVAARVAAAEPTADEIIADMRATYALASSYQDSGTASAADGRRTTTEQHFTTGFTRNDRFRIEVIESAAGRHDARLVVWSDGQHTLVFDAGNIVDRHQPLGETLGKASPMSLGVTSTVPAMLLPGEAGMHATNLSGLVLVGTERIDDHPCWHLAHGDLALWIDQTSHLLRKRTERSHGRLVTLSLAPVLDGSVDPRALARPGAKVGAAEVPTLTMADKQAYVEDNASSLVDQEAPGFSVERIRDKAPLELAKLRGHVVILEFFEAECPPCGKAAEEIEKVAVKHARDGVYTIALSGETPDTISRFETAHQLTYSLARDKDNAIQIAYRVEAIPMFVVIDPAGVIRATSIRVDEAEAAVAKLTAH